MTDAEKEIREALAAGPTPGPWCIYPETDGTEICAVDLVPGLPIRQVIAHPKHGANWIANARLIAACHPAAIRELLAERDGWRLVPVEPTGLMVDAGREAMQPKREPTEAQIEAATDAWQAHCGLLLLSREDARDEVLIVLRAALAAKETK